MRNKRVNILCTIPPFTIAIYNFSCTHLHFNQRESVTFYNKKTKKELQETVFLKSSFHFLASVVSNLDFILDDLILYNLEKKYNEFSRKITHTVSKSRYY